MYDISYKIAWKMAGPFGVVRYFVQNRLENGRTTRSCTIFRTKPLEKRPDRSELYDFSYKIAWKTAGPLGVVRYFVQNRLRNGRTARSCTIFRTKSIEERPDRVELYDISYKTAWKTAGPLGVVRYFVQNRLKNGRTARSCTIFRTKSIEERPDHVEGAVQKVSMQPIGRTTRGRIVSYAPMAGMFVLRSTRRRGHRRDWSKASRSMHVRIAGNAR